MLKLDKVKKNYGEKEVLKNIDFCIKREASIVGLIGPNGVGKSTLLRIIAGVLLPNGGQIIESSSKEKLYENWAHDNTIFVPSGERGLKNKLTILENSVYFASLKGVKKSESRKDILKLSKIMKFDELLNTTYEKLSTGQKKKAAILVSTALNSKYLLLDEPSNGLDINAQESLVELFLYLKNKKEKTLIISSHDPGIMSKIVDHYLFIKEGSICCDTEYKFEEKELISKYHEIYD